MEKVYVLILQDDMYGEIRERIGGIFGSEEKAKEYIYRRLSRDVVYDAASCEYSIDKGSYTVFARIFEWEVQ